MLLCGGHGPGGQCAAGYSDRLGKQEPLSAYTDPGPDYTQVTLTAGSRHTAVQEL